MRNWNTVYYMSEFDFLNYFYSTYEELKHKSIYTCPIYSQIFTLPMRNWNIYAQVEIGEIKIRFLLYLWGIETLLKNGVKSNFFTFLLYLWGIETTVHIPKKPRGQHIFTLPMRNWNFCTLRMSSLLQLQNFYSTYEELKRSLLIAIASQGFGNFYSTYEELKPADRCP